MNKYIIEYTGRFVLIGMVLAITVIPLAYGYYYFWKKKHQPCNIYWIDDSGNKIPGIVSYSSDDESIRKYSIASREYISGKNSWQNHEFIRSPFIETIFFSGEMLNDSIMEIHPDKDGLLSMFESIYVYRKFVR